MFLLSSKKSSQLLLLIVKNTFQFPFYRSLLCLFYFWPQDYLLRGPENLRSQLKSTFPHTTKHTQYMQYRHNARSIFWPYLFSLFSLDLSFCEIGQSSLKSSKNDQEKICPGNISLSLCPGTKKFPCPTIPLSRDEKSFLVLLSLCPNQQQRSRHKLPCPRTSRDKKRSKKVRNFHSFSKIVIFFYFFLFSSVPWLSQNIAGQDRLSKSRPMAKCQNSVPSWSVPWQNVKIPYLPVP